MRTDPLVLGSGYPLSARSRGGGRRVRPSTDERLVDEVTLGSLNMFDQQFHVVVSSRTGRESSIDVNKAIRTNEIPGLATSMRRCNGHYDIVLSGISN